MKIYCFLCLFLFVVIDVADFDTLDSDVQLANGRPAFPKYPIYQRNSRKIDWDDLTKFVSEYKRGKSIFVPKRFMHKYLKKHGDGKSGHGGKPATAEPPVGTYGWKNIPGDYGKYLYFLRNSSKYE
ncbi:unnamed protein product [Trichobilharzia szidati]|nr:unnamed protein product [Trichobilharzia szidati]